MISADERHKIAIIPGIFLGQNAHAFVQVLDGVEGTTAYIKYPSADFSAERNRFAIQVGNNQFDESKVVLAVDSPEAQLSGEILFGKLKPWPVSLLSPGIMGWYAWVPRMECYHGVLSFSHSLEGSLTLNGKVMDFSGGKGYIEKDWGQAFPSAWIWFQSNHFTGQSASLTASVAMIPWLGQAFRGFIVGLWLDGKLHRFATYSGGRIEKLQVLDDHVSWVLRNRESRLFLKAYRANGGLLRGPTRVDMGQRVPETLNATVEVRLESSSGEVLFEDLGENTGLEVIGDLQRLLRG